MKKIIIPFVLLLLLSFSVQAQDAPSNDSEFNTWQARFRVASVIPSLGDNLEGADVDISTTVIPEVDFTYFFSKHWAAELILATTKHEVEVEGLDLGHVWLLPPTLNVQYHFYSGDFKPYVGAGVNYTIFYGEDTGDVVGMDYENSVGFSFQAGIDYNLNDKWFLNLDVKQLLLSTDVTVNAGEAVIPVEVDINPLIIGLGIGVKL
ncbi:OmpW/AlkL family protein [Olleya marilimosa]|uniref:OmpW/AlkL family protein n=1 Tax=Olleya marilimosa TaxID=272164 RepID=UPI00168CD8DC|nr:OmpW family outer membrane protein [Olleya marilimosa]MBD3889717.1 OmpW family protein [Olleya marilimosa]